MTTSELETFLRDTAEQHGIPGASVGVYAGGQELFASTGVTSLAGPRPVTEHTPFDVGSVSKTFTATAVVRLAAAGWIALDAPVSRYVPEFDVSPGITVLRLLNHTAGIDWRLLEDTGDGDGALAAFVKRLAGQPLIAEPGERASYSQAGYSVL
ncbi:MAG: beta-lactamase family protein, partial [Nonomuraea sp.]|nr:beta-lactamase family protein [Nonomuraea sp.]